MAMKLNTRKVFDWVKEHDGENFTAKDIAEAIGLSAASVNGIVTSAFQRKNLMERVPAEVELEDVDGNVSHKAVKFIRLTDEGRMFDPDAETEVEEE